MRLRPLRDFVVVRLLPEPQPKGQIIQVAFAPKPSVRAEVVAVGPEVRDVRVGQRVVISRLQGVQVELNEPLVLVRESAVLGLCPVCNPKEAS